MPGPGGGHGLLIVPSLSREQRQKAACMHSWPRWVSRGAPRAGWVPQKAAGLKLLKAHQHWSSSVYHHTVQTGHIPCQGAAATRRLGAHISCSHHFMANRRKKVEAVADFIFLGCKITADRDYSHEIKRGLPLGRKAMRNLDSVLKSSDSADKGPYSQSCGFSSSYVWM